MIKHIKYIVGITYATGFNFGMMRFHSQIQNYTDFQLNLSNFDKLDISYGEHLKIGHIVGCIYLKALPLYIFKNQSLKETFDRTKFPSYIKEI